MSEQTDHLALFNFLARMEGRYPAFAYVKHTPNGEKRDIITAARLKRMGVRPGVWDIEFIYPNQGEFEGVTAYWYHGIAIEMKSKLGALSPDQRRWQEHYRQNEWATYVCHDWTEAARLLIRWVGGNPDDVEGL